MRSFDDVSNPFKKAVFIVTPVPRDTVYTHLAPNPDYKGRTHLPTRMDGCERAIITGQLRVVTNTSPL